MTLPLADRARQLATAWQAAQVTLYAGEDSATATASGGGLQAALDDHGVGALGASLADGERLELRDGAATVSLTRHGAAGALRVSWEGGPTYEQRVPLSPVLAGAAAPVVRGGEAKGAPVSWDALADVGRRLLVRGGQLYDVGGCPADAIDGVVPAVSPGSLGDPSFMASHGVRAAYVAGAMAGGIASVPLVSAMCEAGLLAFFGAGGLPLSQVESALGELSSRLGSRPWGCNLLHNPAEPRVEDDTVALMLAAGCRYASASAYMTLTPAVVRFRAAGLSSGPGGTIVEDTHLFAKVSRPEVAERFLSPAPESILIGLVAAGHITEEQAALARRVPLARDITAEADSGGHTDSRPLPVLLPLLTALRDRIAAEHGYSEPPRIGAAGGLGDPASIYGALSMGAAYVLTGSINQSCMEAGTSDAVKAMLAKAGMADVATGPAPDMFELGAHVQVLAKGTMYAQRSRRLYDLYKAFDGLDSLPAAVRTRLETRMFKRTIDDIWADTRAYWAERDPREVERADRDPKHHMALVFRWYLGMTSRWARQGDPDRVRDYQVWCGPSMGLFNGWAAGTALESPENRRVVAVADALLHGAAVCARQQVARLHGVRG